MLFVLHCAVASAQDGSIQFIDNDLNDALRIAQDQNKLIFIDGYANWCIPCKLMEEEVFTNNQVSEYFNKHFVNLKIDLEKGMGPLLAARYNAQVLPAYFVITHDETLIYRFSGFQRIPELLLHASKARAPELVLEAWDARYAEGDRKPNFLYNYTWEKHRAGDPDYRRLVDEYLQTQENWSTNDNLKFIFHFVESSDGPLFGHMLDNRVLYDKVLGKEKVDHSMEILVNQAIYHGQREMSVDEVSELYVKAFPERGHYRALQFKLKYYKWEEHPDSIILALDYAMQHGIKIDSTSQQGYVEKVLALQVPSEPALRKVAGWLESEDLANNSLGIRHRRKLASIYELLGDIGKASKHIKLARKSAKILKDKNLAKHLKTEYKRLRKMQ